MSAFPPGDWHRIDQRREHRVDCSDGERFDEDPAYAGETLDANSRQVRVHMVNPPKAQDGGCGTPVADGGSERVSSSEDDDQQDGSEEEDDSSGDGSSAPNVDARTCKLPLGPKGGAFEGSSDPAGREQGAPRDASESGVGA